MSFDGITTCAIVNELNNTLKNARIEKIYVPNKSEIIISFHTQDRNNYKLLISIDANNSRIHLTNSSRENPIQAPQFCMILRKYMQGGKILDIYQNKLDRVIFIKFENINDFGDYVTKCLVIELMGKYSNVILIDDDKIIDSMKHVTNTMSSVREVLPGKKYIMPSSLGKLDFLETSFHEFEISLSKDEKIPNAISNKFTGISRAFIQGICRELEYDDNLLVSDFSNDKLQKIYEYINSILSSIPTKSFNVKYTVDNKDYYLVVSEESKLELFSKALDHFYNSKENVSILKNAKLNIEREINSQLSKILMKQMKYVKNLYHQE